LRRGCLTLLAVLLLAVLLLAVLLAPFALRATGDFLVDDHAPVKADAAIVLAGDWTGARVLKAGQLVKDGFVPVALVSGPTLIYGNNEADLAIAFAAAKGYPAAEFNAIHEPAFSTRDESEVFYTELKRRGIRSILLVTSNFHTHRSGIVFRKRFKNEIAVTTVAAPSEYFHPDRWWKEREGQKVVFYEWSKTLATPFGL
jgi:uncharacterized SAM-binding protein YcdF (DUF218 family)